MPVADTTTSMTSIESPVLGSFKAHKPLPRKDADPHDSKQETFKRRQEALRDIKQKNRSVYMTNDGIRSWIPDPNDDHTLSASVRPLTPPISFRDNFRSWIDDSFLKHQTLGRKGDSSGTTPLVQQSPPTPETTPPRKIGSSPFVDTLPDARASTDRLTETSKHPAESRTDSFRTARENQSSDDESHPDESPSLRASRQRWLRDTGLAKNTGIGLGLGLGLEPDGDDMPTPMPAEPTSRQVFVPKEDFVSFNGVWGSDSPSGMEDTESQTTALRDSEYKNLTTSENPTQPKIQDPSSKDQETQIQRNEAQVGTHNDSTDAADVALRKQKRQSAKANAHGVEEMQELNKNRLSQASTNSTIVEAMVIDALPARRRTLRHTGRIVGLDPTRSTHGLLKASERTGQHRLRNVKSPTRGLRQSFAFEDAQLRAPSSLDVKREKPVMAVIPDRRASLQSSVSSSKRFSRTFSVSSQQHSSRPTTAPEDMMSYFDIPHRERKSVSVIIQQAVPLKAETRVEKVLSSPITTDTTPTAVAASRELSRTTSVTSGGLRTHYIPGTPSSQESGPPHPTEIQDNLIMSVQRSNSGDWAASRPRSAMVTPFSLRSAHSSTPGTLEVSEATAVNIYPHTNESILVIQEMAGRDDLYPREQSAIIAGNASIAIPGNTSPVVYQERLPSPPPRTISDSPLQNPRDPPQPPDFKVIPPTPANGRSSSDETVPAAKRARRSSRLSAPINSLKRAMSARRHSESIVNPLTRTFSLRNNSLRRGSRAMNDEENNLHPLWRPRTFWDSQEDNDSDSEFGNVGVLSPRRSTGDSSPRRSMSLTRRLTSSLRSGSVQRTRRASSSSANRNPHYSAHVYADADPMPKRAQSLSRRIGGSLRLPYRSKIHNTNDWDGQPHYEFVRPIGQEDDEMPRQGYPVHFVGLRGLAERLERRRETKEEGKREERRNWLRGRIGLVGPKDLTGFDIINPVRPIADD